MPFFNCCLPSIVCPQLLFALNWCLPSTLIRDNLHYRGTHEGGVWSLFRLTENDSFVLPVDDCIAYAFHAQEESNVFVRQQSWYVARAVVSSLLEAMSRGTVITEQYAKHRQQRLKAIKNKAQSRAERRTVKHALVMLFKACADPDDRYSLSLSLSL